jgi:hypothetical protein
MAHYLMYSLSMGFYERGLAGYWKLIFERLPRDRVFVETGTFEGQTTRWALDSFKHVHSIEASNLYHEVAKNNLKDTDAKLHFGESPEVLGNLLPTLDFDFFVFFLDAHFSSGDTYGDYVNQPLLEELETIAKHIDLDTCLILVDDMRLLTGHLGYPTLSEIWRIFSGKGSVECTSIDDVLVISGKEITNKIGNPNDFSIVAGLRPHWQVSN